MKKMISRNALTFTGRLIEDAQIFNNGTTARFRLAHNFGGETKDGSQKATLFIDCVMFAAKGTVHEKEIPADLLKKGTSVELQGSLRPNVHTVGDKTYYSTEILVSSIGNVSYKDIPDIQEKAQEKAEPAPQEAPAAEAEAETPAAGTEAPKKAQKRTRKAASAKAA